MEYSETIIVSCNKWLCDLFTLTIAVTVGKPEVV